MHSWTPVTTGLAEFRVVSVSKMSISIMMYRMMYSIIDVCDHPSHLLSANQGSLKVDTLERTQNGQN